MLGPAEVAVSALKVDFAKIHSLYCRGQLICPKTTKRSNNTLQQGRAY